LGHGQVVGPRHWGIAWLPDTWRWDCHALGGRTKFARLAMYTRSPGFVDPHKWVADPRA